MMKNLKTLFGAVVGAYLEGVAKRQDVVVDSVNEFVFVAFVEEKTGVRFVVATDGVVTDLVVSFNGIVKRSYCSSAEIMEILGNPFKFLGIETKTNNECFDVCDCCGGTHKVVPGYGTLFDEYMFICEDCLSRAMAEEFAPSPLEVAQNKLEEMALSDEMIYGFTVEDTAVIVQWFNGGQIVKTNLVECDNNDEAIGVLCELC